MTQDSGTPSAIEQAARWFAAQQRKLGTLEERESYRRWSQARTHRRALARMHALWADLERVYAPAEHGAMARPSRKVALAIGCMAVAALGLMFCAGGPFWTSLDWTTR